MDEDSAFGRFHSGRFSESKRVVVGPEDLRPIYKPVPFEGVPIDDGSPRTVTDVLQSLTAGVSL